MRVPFDYAVVRLVPRVEREEFINVGVIVHADVDVPVVAPLVPAACPDDEERGGCAGPRHRDIDGALLADEIDTTRLPLCASRKLWPSACSRCVLPRPVPPWMISGLKPTSRDVA